MTVSTMFGTGKKYTIWHFVFSKSPENKFARQCEAVNVMNIVYFYENFFRFTKNFLPLLIM